MPSEDVFHIILDLSHKTRDGFLPPMVQCFVSGDCSANRPNKSPVCGVGVVGQCEGNNGEDEVEVLCEGDVSGGTHGMRANTAI